MQLSDFTGQPCKSSMAYEFLPKKKESLDLEAIAKKLKARNVYIEVESPFILLLKIGGRNVSFFKSGKILVKQTQDANEARKAAEELINCLK